MALININSAPSRSSHSALRTNCHLRSPAGSSPSDKILRARVVRPCSPERRDGNVVHPGYYTERVPTGPDWA
ncbi:unnamed protein product, partial [Nesidiocoris tenuis]